MSAKIVVPDLGESVIEATISEWLKNAGDKVTAGEAVVVLETDKVTLEVAAEAGGILARIERQSGEDVKVGDVLGIIEESVTNGASTDAAEGDQKQSKAVEKETTKQEAQPYPAEQSLPLPEAEKIADSAKERVTPVARRMAQEKDIDLAQVTPKDGERVTKEDVQRYLEGREVPAQAKPTEPTTTARSLMPAPERNGREERRRMSRRRQTIARRLIEAQQAAAMLTTFNEIDMYAVMTLRARRKESFKEKYGVSLGLSSFFVKATIGALKAFPLLNGEIQGDEIVLKHYYDIGIAIGAEEGLVVPVLRAADHMSFAEIEHGVRDYAQQSADGKLSIEALRGGTFTITNGGIFGSMLSTPILNPPQVGILGLHAIKDRPVVLDGEIKVRPIMYVALTYDHRLIDGREAVQFLVRIKELIEDPETLLLEG
jgi:2-oxoglutarate dehydrogenase E2 component (dihydrolipoamide succinyltransferase)